MSRGTQPFAEGFLAAMWGALGGDTARAEAVEFTGDAVLPGCFAFTDLCAASFATASAAIAELLSEVESGTPSVTVDRTLASAWARNATRPVGPRRPPVRLPDIGGEYRTADDRWLRLRSGYPHLRAAILGVLGTSDDRAAVAAEVARHRADDLEQAIIDGGGTAGVGRTVAEWAAHPAGRAVAAEPLIDVMVRDVAEDRWSPTPGRPLAGIRVLDCTRVIAGPMATRFLAGFGAEVLRIDPPGYEEADGTSGGELVIGKRCARLDLKGDDGRARFLELLAGADVFIHGLRPGALDGLGLSAAVRAAARPGLVEVVHDAYGWSGPWAARRGFDATVQMSSGIMLETMRWANIEAPAMEFEQPVILDHSTGYLIAASAVRGLTRRLRSGEGSLSRLALARTAGLLTAAGPPPEEPGIRLPLDGPFDPFIYTTIDGPVRRLQFPVVIGGTPFFFERPGDPYGSAVPSWTTSPTAGRALTD